jgi:hypothetical protein
LLAQGINRRLEVVDLGVNWRPTNLEHRQEALGVGGIAGLDDQPRIKPL